MRWWKDVCHLSMYSTFICACWFLSTGFAKAMSVLMPPSCLAMWCVFMLNGLPRSLCSTPDAADMLTCISAVHISFYHTTAHPFVWVLRFSSCCLSTCCGSAVAPPQCLRYEHAHNFSSCCRCACAYIPQNTMSTLDRALLFFVFDETT